MNFPKIYDYELSNGLKILVVPRHDIPKVSIQLWYNVGSKDETTAEKGIAHLIEHMIFKGTEKLSECDINLITHKLSGSTNAFTSYDYTGYLFDFPSQHWYEALPIMADCMQNTTFKEEYLNSELKAVIQELKMYKDDYVSSVIESVMASTFSGHPYQHPIIGYKQDLWNLYRKDLLQFYEKHYIPNNATLIVVGDVNPENVLELSKKYFGDIQPNLDYKKQDFYYSPDINSRSVTIYRDVKQPIVLLSWIAPGLKEGKDYIIDILSGILAGGRSSRLYNILVNELQLVSEVEAFAYDLFDYSQFMIYLQPHKQEDIEMIINIVNKELYSLIEKGITDNELNRVKRKAELKYLKTFESNQKFAYNLGKYYLATGNKNYVYDYFQSFEKEDLKIKVQDLAKEYLKPYLVNIGKVMPLKDDQKDYWLKIQKISDKEDAKILDGRERSLELEEGKCVFDIQAKPLKEFDYPKSQNMTLDNGLKVLYFNNSKLPKVDLILNFKARNTYDPIGLEGLCYFTYEMLLEGTKNYSAQELSSLFESYGIKIDIHAGTISISCLSKELPKALDLLNEVLVNANFTEEAIEKIRQNTFSRINDLWDTPKRFVNLLAEEAIYRSHPYSKNILGTQESIARIARQDIINFYEKYLTPLGATLSIVGDLDSHNIKELLNNSFKLWTGIEVENLIYPEIIPVSSRDINYSINRDQVVLCYAGLSIDRNSIDFDKLLIFDQILTGGVLGSMSSRLFDLRERSGLFYTIGGSLLYRTGLEPGLVLIKTIVSQDKLAAAEEAIEKTINSAYQEISDNEFEEAKRAITNSLVDNFSSNSKIARTFLFIDKFNLPKDYFDNRAEELELVTKEQIKQAVKKYLNTSKMIKVRAGRV